MTKVTVQKLRVNVVLKKISNIQPCDLESWKHLGGTIEKNPVNKHFKFTMKIGNTKLNNITDKNFHDIILQQYRLMVSN